jgi:hypothetical protein
MIRRSIVKINFFGDLKNATKFSLTIFFKEFFQKLKVLLFHFDVKIICFKKIFIIIESNLM